MSEIKKGDLVMIVRGVSCCGRGSHVGRVFIAKKISFRAAKKCNACGAPTPATVTVDDYSIYRLKKIDPPSTGEYDRVPVRKTEPAEVL